MTVELSEPIKAALEINEIFGPLFGVKFEEKDSAKSEPGRWIPKGETVEVGGRRIAGMVYHGFPASYESGSSEIRKSGVYIDPAMSVGGKGCSSDDRNLFTFAYQHLDKFTRGAYLDWLESGRSDPKCSKLFPVLYFLGLERRIMLDKPPAKEKKELIAEVKRLRDCYSDREMFASILTDFLKIVGNRTKLAEMYELDGEDTVSITHLENALAVGNSASINAPIDGEAFLQLHNFVQYVKYWGFVKSPPLFDELFLLRFAKEYPTGVAADDPSVKYGLTYTAFSAEFEVSLELTHKKQKLFDILRWVTHGTPIIDFAGVIEEDLRAHTSYISRFPERLGSLEAMIYLPDELKNYSYLDDANVRTELGKLRNWALKVVKKGLHTTVAEVVKQAKISIGKGKDDVTFTQWRRVVTKFARCGIGVAPAIDLRFRQNSLADTAVLFTYDELKIGKRTESRAYQIALEQIVLGAYLLQMESRSRKETAKILLAHINGLDALKKFERDKLAANIECVLACPLDRTYLRRLRVRVIAENREELRTAVVKFAKSDKMASAHSVAVLEKIYAALGLPPELAYSDLHAGEVVSRGHGAKQSKSKSAELNEDRINSIRSDTEKVSKVLGNIFAADEKQDKQSPKEQELLIPGLDNNHAGFLKALIKKKHWTEKTLANLADKFGLLPVGAMETINEWAFERFAESLVDEHDGYHLVPDIASKLKAELKGMK